MKRILYGMIVMGMVLSAAGTVYASDWDKAGKILTATEGVRILTGGNVDIIGTMTGVRPRAEVVQANTRYVYVSPREEYRPQRVWVPDYVWVTEYIPRHVEYNGRYSRVVVEGHYIRYQVQQGGHWEHQGGTFSGPGRHGDNDRGHRWD